LDALYPGYELPANADRAVATLRAELEARGLTVGRDTTGFKRDLYVGASERPAILFEFKAGVDHASDSMYHGRWEPGMPRRVAVVPRTDAGSSSAEVLAQAGIDVLQYTAFGESIVFAGLDELLARLR
jgi:MOSC domain-containing protein YiiM